MSLDPRHQRIAFLVLLIATVCLMGWLSRQGKSLQTGAAPYGAVSLQLAWSHERAQKIINSWKDQKDRAYLQHYYDFLFIAVYPLFLSLSCALLSRWVSGAISLIGVALSWTILLAAPLDTLENILALRMLSSAPSELLSRLTTICSAFKWASIFSVIGYWFAALLQWIRQLAQ